MVRMIVEKGKEYMLVPRAEYEELRANRAKSLEPDLPSFPAKLPDGNYPALEYLAASLARDIIRSRRKLGLSQAELARRAGVRVETLNRIERMKGPPSVRTVEKIDRALKAAEAATLPRKQPAKPGRTLRGSRGSERATVR